jgi:hypothetical protein
MACLWMSACCGDAWAKTAQDPSHLLRVPIPAAPVALSASPTTGSLPDSSPTPSPNPSPDVSPDNPFQVPESNAAEELLFPSNLDENLLLSLDAEQETSEEPLPPQETEYERLEKRPTARHFWEGAIPAGNASTLSSLEQITEISALQSEGPVRLRLQLQSALVGDDNITLDKKGRKKDVLMSLGPSAAVSLGSEDTPFRLTGSYSGAAVAFARTAGQKSYDQTANISAGWNGQKLRITVRGGVQQLHATSNDVGDRVGRRIVYGGLHTAYAWGEKLTSEWSADATHASFQALLRSNEYRTQTFLQYTCTPKIRVGIGNTVGWLIPEKGERQSYSQGLVRAVYAPTAKLTLDTQIGGDVRQFRGGRARSVSPVFSLAASWAATPKTQFSLEGRRRIFASSALASQNYAVTGVSVSVNHLLSETLAAGLSTGFENAAYSATRTGIVADRRDRYGFFRLYLNWVLNRRLSLGAFYELGRNASTGTQNREFTRNRVGLSASLTF